MADPNVTRELTELRNCWTCSGDHPADHSCMVRTRLWDACTEECDQKAAAITEWIESRDLDEAEMPPKDADGCPGWEVSDV